MCIRDSCQTVETLWEPALPHNHCAGVKTVRDIVVHDPIPQPAADALETYVTTEFTITWRWLHVDPSLNGDISWGTT